jgi:hypothetical protein
MNLRCVVVAVLLGACGTPESKHDVASRYAQAPDPNAPPPTDVVAKKTPWTDRFMKPSVLVADQVRIEGPVGLLEHLATPSNPELHERTEKTVPAGYLQQITAKEGIGPVEIQAQLDNLTIVALKKLVVLERPGPVDLVVLAAGDAYFNDKSTAEEQRADSLRFVGQIDR